MFERSKRAPILRRCFGEVNPKGTAKCTWSRSALGFPLRLPHFVAHWVSPCEVWTVARNCTVSFLGALKCHVLEAVVASGFPLQFHTLCSALGFPLRSVVLR